LPAREERELLGIAWVYAAVGGYTDAYAFITHGLFANAQTGNVLFFAIDGSAGQWGRAMQHVPPIFAFGLGVARRSCSARSRRSARFAVPSRAWRSSSRFSGCWWRSARGFRARR